MTRATLFTYKKPQHEATPALIKAFVNGFYAKEFSLADTLLRLEALDEHLLTHESDFALANVGFSWNEHLGSDEDYDEIMLADTEDHQSLMTQLVRLFPWKREVIKTNLTLANDPHLTVEPLCELIEHLLKKKYPADILNPLSQSPLHYAVARNLQPLVALLLRYDANPNIQDSSGETPLSDAINVDSQADSMALFEMLLKAGADPHVISRNGFTLLHYAVAQSNSSVVDRLMELQVNASLKEECGFTPLHMALRDCPSIARRLLQYGSSLTVLNEFDQTPFHLAATSSLESVQVCVELASNPEDLYTPNQEGMTVFDLLEDYSAPIRNYLRDFNQSYQDQKALQALSFSSPSSGESADDSLHHQGSIPVDSAEGNPSASLEALKSRTGPRL